MFLTSVTKENPLGRRCKPNTKRFQLGVKSAASYSSHILNSERPVVGTNTFAPECRCAEYRLDVNCFFPTYWPDSDCTTGHVHVCVFLLNRLMSRYPKTPNLYSILLGLQQRVEAHSRLAIIHRSVHQTLGRHGNNLVSN